MPDVFYKLTKNKYRTSPEIAFAKTVMDDALAHAAHVAVEVKNDEYVRVAYDETPTKAIDMLMTEKSHLAFVLRRNELMCDIPGLGRVHEYGEAAGCTMGRKNDVFVFITMKIDDMRDITRRHRLLEL